MALKDMFAVIDNSLSEIFHRKEAKPEQLRAPLLKGIEQAKKQFENGSTKAPNRWWKVSNGIVALTVKVKGHPISLNGQTTNHVHEEHFIKALDALKHAVENGELDKELKGTAEDAKVPFPAAGRTRRASVEWSTDPKKLHAQFVEHMGPPPGEGYVPNSKRTKWVNAARAAGGQKAQSVRKK